MWNKTIILSSILIGAISLKGYGQQIPIEITTQTGHTSGIREIYYSKDSKKLYTFDQKQVGKIWYLPTANEIGTLKSDEIKVERSFIGSSVISIAGVEIENPKRINPLEKIQKNHLSGNNDENEKYEVRLKRNKVRVLNQARQNVISLRGVFSDEDFTSAAISEKYDLVIAGNTDGLIYVGDLKTGKRLKALKGHLAKVNDVAFDPNYPQFASASDDRSVIIWDIATMKPIKKLAPRSFGLTAMDITSDARYLAIGDELGSVKLLDLEDYRFEVKHRIFNLGKIYDLKFVGENNNLLVSFEKNRFYLLDGKTLEVLNKKTYRTKRGALRVIKNLNKDRFYGIASHVFQIEADPTEQYAMLLGRYQTRQSEQPVYRYDLDIVDTRTLKRKTKFSRQDLNSSNPMMLKFMEYVTELDRVVDNSGEYLYSRIGNGQVPVANLRFHDEDLVYISDQSTLVSEKFGVLKEGKASFSTTSEGRLKTVFAVDNNGSYAFENFKEIKLVDGDREFMLAGHTGEVTSLKFDQERRRLFSSSLDGTIKIWDTRNGSLLISIVPIDLDKAILLSANNYYYSPKSALNGISFKRGDQYIPASQFDLQFNRPDIVLDDLGSMDPSVIRLFGAAYQKRKQRLGLTDKEVSVDFNLPEVFTESSIPTISADKTIPIKVMGKDRLYELSHFNVKINGVPIFGTKGFQVSGQEYVLDTEIELSNGKNEIEISVVNENGVESLKEIFQTTYSGSTQPGNLHFVALSVSDYRNSEFNLDYAKKDGDDLSRLFRTSSNQYGKVFLDTLFDTEATKENFQSIRQNLFESKVDDQVIIFISGHGLLDDSLNFYYATHDTDFEKPNDRGIPYEQIEGILDSIPARKKLLLIDACHSGEIDKEGVVATGEVEAKNITFRGFKSYSTKKSIIGLPNSFQLMRELFSDLSNSSGVVVISAASGVEYAYESSDYKNGVFSYSLIEGLEKKLADLDKDKTVTIGELQQYVSERVQILTDGKQNPTSRRENLSNNYIIWEY